MITNVIFSFFISGGLTAFLYYLAGNFVNPVVSSLISCFLLATFCQFLSYKTKRPDATFIIPGIMPVVPGSLLFRAFDALVESNYMKAVDYGTQAITSRCIYCTCPCI